MLAAVDELNKFYASVLIPPLLYIITLEIKENEIHVNQGHILRPQSTKQFILFKL